MIKLNQHKKRPLVNWGAPEMQAFDTNDGALKLVEQYIAEYAAHPFGGTEVGNVLDDALGTRGKMIRPRLLLLTAELGPKRDQEKLCKLAALVELTHTASLIHDDIVDDAPSRRGKPSLQMKYGKDAAVYAGDYLMSRVTYFAAIGNLTQGGAIIAQTVGEMCAGEIGQTLCRYREHVRVEDYLRNIHGKTAALFMAACRIGAEESGCDRAIVETMERFGECMGLLFQLRDDLLDYTADSRALGKESHKDFQDGIYTMPLLWALRQPEGAERLLPILHANREQALTPEQLLEMERTVVELGGVEAVRREIRCCQNEAEKLLRTLPPRACIPLLRGLLRKLEV